MPRAVRRVVVYVCTLNGQIYKSAKEAKAAAKELREKATKREKRKATRGNQTLAILRALHAGHETPVAIKKAARVPPDNVNPTLHRLRKQGLVDGPPGTHRLTAKGKAQLEALAGTKR